VACFTTWIGRRSACAQANHRLTSSLATRRNLTLISPRLSQSLLSSTARYCTHAAHAAHCAPRVRLRATHYPAAACTRPRAIRAGPLIRRLDVAF